MMIQKLGQTIDQSIKHAYNIQNIAKSDLIYLKQQYLYFIFNKLFEQIILEKPWSEIATTHPLNPIKYNDLINDSKTAPIQIKAAEENIHSLESNNYDEVTILEPITEQIELLNHENGITGDDYFSVKTQEFDFPKMNLNQTAKQEQSLLVTMSFQEWLGHITKKNFKEKQEEEEKRALKHLWQQQKLAAALEEENDEIPEQVFEMAINSIAQQDNLVSEPLADLYAKQGKIDQAIDMYKKLILQNPSKSSYFAVKLDKLKLDL